MSLNDLIQRIHAYVVSCGGDFRNWYVGIAEDARQRLFNDHNVTEHGGQWVFATAFNDSIARDVESYFLAQHGMKGGPGGGSRLSKAVYAYRITNATRE